MKKIPSLHEVVQNLIERGGSQFANELNTLITGNPIVKANEIPETKIRLAYIYPKNVTLSKESQKRLLSLILGGFKNKYSWIPGEQAVIEIKLNKKLNVCAVPVPLKEFLKSTLPKYIEGSPALAAYTRKIYKKKK